MSRVPPTRVDRDPVLDPELEIYGLNPEATHANTDARPNAQTRTGMNIAVVEDPTNKLQAQLLEYQTELQNTLNFHEAATKERDTLREQNKKLVGALKSANDELGKRETRLTEATRQEHALEAQIKQLTEKTRLVNTTNEQVTKRVRELESNVKELGVLRMRVETGEAKVQGLTKQLEQAKQTQNDTAASLEARTKELKDLHAKHAALSTELQQSKASVASQQSARETAVQRVQKLEAELRDTSTKLKTASERGKRLEECEKSLQDKNQLIATTQSTMHELQKFQQTAKRTQTELQAALVTAQATVAQVTTEHSVAVQTCHALQTQVNECTQRAEALQQTVSEQEKQLQALRVQATTLSQLQTDHATLRNAHEQLSGEHTRQGEQYTRNTATVAAANEKIGVLQQKLQTQESALRERDKQLAALQTIQQQLERYQAEVPLTKFEELTRWREQHERLPEELKQTQGALSDTIAQLNQVEQDSAQLRDLLSKLRADNADPVRLLSQEIAKDDSTRVQHYAHQLAELVSGHPDSPYFSALLCDLRTLHERNSIMSNTGTLNMCVRALHHHDDADAITTDTDAEAVMHRSRNIPLRTIARVADQTWHVLQQRLKHIDFPVRCVEDKVVSRMQAQIDQRWREFIPNKLAHTTPHVLKQGNSSSPLAMDAFVILAAGTLERLNTLVQTFIINSSHTYAQSHRNRPEDSKSLTDSTLTVALWIVLIPAEKSYISDNAIQLARGQMAKSLENVKSLRPRFVLGDSDWSPLLWYACGDHLLCFEQDSTVRLSSLNDTEVQSVVEQTLRLMP
jgi:DNA repair exonuclease SbcCD ATPase subunit